MTDKIDEFYVGLAPSGIWRGVGFLARQDVMGPYYRGYMMFHPSKLIVESFIRGDQDLIDRFQDVVTGDGSLSNLLWVRSTFVGFLENKPPRTEVWFTVYNERLADIEHTLLLRLKAAPYSVDRSRNNFILTKRY